MAASTTQGKTREGNAARQKRLQSAVKLGPDQVVHYTPGKGYWAGPRVGAGAPAAPVAPVDPMAPRTEAQIQADAAAQAKAALAPQTAEIDRQRAIAEQRARNDREALTGLGKTVAEMQRGLAPGVQGAYGTAGAEIGSLAQGFSSGVAERMAAGQQGNAEFAASQGAQATPVVDPTAVKDVMYGTGGFIPGASLAAQGAAAGTWAQTMPAITALAMAGDFKKALYEAREKDDEYAQQLITTAAKYPELRDRALEELRKHEIAKANYKIDQRQVAVQESAQKLYETKANEDVRGNKAAEQLKRESVMIAKQRLQLDNEKAADALKQKVKEGTKIDAEASKVLGYVVDKEGREVLDADGQRIKVKPTSSGGTETERNPYGAAVDAAKTLRGDPTKNPSPGPGSPGAYLARPGAKGVFKRPGFPATTNDPKKALFNGEYTFVEAMGFLQARYGISRAQARKALVASGWKPDGVRPKG